MRSLFRPSFSSVVVALSLVCLGTVTHSSVAFSASGAIAQAETSEDSEAETETTVQLLQSGDQGEAVIALQEKLQTLGYFRGEPDGDYGPKTQTAVAAFQDSEGLTADGIAGATTLSRIDDAIAQQEDDAEPSESDEENTDEENTGDSESPNNRRFLLIGGAVATFVLGSLGLIVMLSIFSKAMQPPQPPEDPEPDDLEPEPPTAKNAPFPPAETPDTDLEPEPWFNNNPPLTSKFLTEPEVKPDNNHNTSLIAQASPSENHQIEPEIPPEVSEAELSFVSPPPPPSSSSLALPTETALPKIDLVEELIKELQDTQPDKRRKAIWELAQQADSRAIQPLIGLLIDSDSQQRGLILEALSQIGSRTLKPMNRALTIALQDENAQVRKNAIRDLTQMYELIAKLSKLLYLAVDDPDPEVQETAKWALDQLNNIKIPNFGDKET